MKILVWQWGRRGAGPRFAACLADALREEPDVTVISSLCRDAEIMRGPNAPRCELPVRTYGGRISFSGRLLTAPISIPLLMARLRRIRPDVAICAMPGPLDVVMAATLRLLGIRLVVVVHDAKSRQGDGYFMQIPLQRLLCRFGDSLVTLSSYVEWQIRSQSSANATRRFISINHPPLSFDMPTSPRPPGPPRLLFFGRLLPYKGLDLLAAAISLLPLETNITFRIVGLGPESADLALLRKYPNVSVENRWVSETELGSVLGWADAEILPYREASQSGVAAAAMAANRPVIATRVGGLPEQLSGLPLAMMCDPAPASLADAISRWIIQPPIAPKDIDASGGWKAAATTLLQAVRESMTHPGARVASRNERPIWRLTPRYAHSSNQWTRRNRTMARTPGKTVLRNCTGTCPQRPRPIQPNIMYENFAIHLGIQPSHEHCL